MDIVVEIFLYALCVYTYWERSSPWRPDSRPDDPSDEGHVLFCHGCVAQVPGDGPLQLRASLVQGPQACLQRQQIIPTSEGQLLMVLLFLESPEVVLDQECGVELANSYFLLQDYRKND